MEIALSTIKNYFLELLFPLKCAACGEETGNKKKNRLICSECLKKLSPSSDFFCPLCEAKTADGKLCFSCQIVIGGDLAKFPLDRLLYPFSYKDSLIQTIIKAFKYRFIKDLEIPLGRLMAGYLEKIKNKVELNDLAIIPVPLYKRKFNQRGYNQSELIAAKVAEYFNADAMAGCLLKIKPTKDQASLKESDRPENLKNAFVCAKPWLVSGKRIMLIDDVYTTGATMAECARVLKTAGAQEIIGLVIARG